MWMTGLSVGAMVQGSSLEFLDHLNNIHENIQFTMETERIAMFPFLTFDMQHKHDGSLGDKVYRKSTCTNLCASVPSLTTILPTDRLYFPCWCTGQGPFVIGKAYVVN
jgi:hypothetical protein